jgi:protein gp37
MKNSSIQWTDHTWNIAVGCSKVDEDCKFCYMYRDSLKSTRYDPKKVRKTKTVFNTPLKIKEPSKIFTSSLTDFFHEDIDAFRDEAWEIIRKCPQHTFQILTKRPERIVDNLPKDFITNYSDYSHIIWGTSVGGDHAEHRVRELIRASLLRPLVKTFLSIEPMFAAVTFLNDYYFKGRGFNHLSKDERTKIGHLISWVVVGGESGNEKGQYRYRECKLEWIEKVINDCRENNIPVFVKQLGTHLAKELKLKDRHGGDIDEWPEHLRIREFPKV